MSAGTSASNQLVKSSCKPPDAKYVHRSHIDGSKRRKIYVLRTIEGFTVADVILVVGQTRQNLQCMYGENRDFDAR